MTVPALLERLFAAGPHPDLGEHAATYGRLIGSWRGEYRDPHPEGDEVGPLEVHFGWALEGRAVQDMWLVPDDAATATRKRSMYGTSLRVFDAAAKLWRVDWFNTRRGAHVHLVGRRIGDDIVQTGYWDDRPQRWCFRDVGADAFTWEAHGLDDDGVSWRLQTRFRLARVR